MPEFHNSSSHGTRRMFRTSTFGGFNKEDVCAYLDVLTREMSIKLKQKEDEILKLDARNKELSAELSALKKQDEKLEHDKSIIADILIKAEENAKKVMDNAISEAEKRKQELQTNCTSERNKLRVLKEELLDLQERAARITRQFEQDISRLGITPDNYTDFD